jgi:hypothetical protein
MTGEEWFRDLLDRMRRFLRQVEKVSQLLSDG